MNAAFCVLGIGARAEVDLRQLELRVLVVEERRRVLQVLDRAVGVGAQADLLEAVAQVPRERGQRLGNERRAPSVVGIGVDVLIRQLAEELIGLGVVGERAGIVGINAGEIELGEEPVRLHGEVGQRPLPEVRFRPSR